MKKAVETAPEFVTIPAGKYSRQRVVQRRIVFYEYTSDGMIRFLETGRKITASVFEVYKIAAAMDGIITMRELKKK